MPSKGVIGELMKKQVIYLGMALVLASCSKQTTTDEVDGQPVDPNVSGPKPEDQPEPPKPQPIFKEKNLEAADRKQVFAKRDTVRCLRHFQSSLRLEPEPRRHGAVCRDGVTRRSVRPECRAGAAAGWRKAQRRS